MERSISLKRVLSRRFSVSSSSFRVTIRFVQISRLPERNALVFIRWPQGTTHQVLSDDSFTATWTSESATLQVGALESIPLQLHENAIKWKKLATGELDLSKLDQAKPDQLVILPLYHSDAKDACMLELRVTVALASTGRARSVSDASAIVVQRDCCDDAFLVRAFFECPLTWRADGQSEGAHRLRRRWPDLSARLYQALQATIETRSDLWLAYWYSAFRQLGADRHADLPRELLLTLRKRAADAIEEAGVMPDAMFRDLMTARFSDDDLMAWASSLARDVGSRVLQRSLVVCVDEPHAMSRDWLLRFDEWLSVRYAVVGARKLLERALECEDED